MATLTLSRPTNMGAQSATIRKCTSDTVIFSTYGPINGYAGVNTHFLTLRFSDFTQLCRIRNK